MKVLGVDYGRKKIGLAIGETEIGLVEPIGMLPSAKFKVQSAKLCQDNDIKVVVIGITGGEIDEEIKTFGKELEKETGLPVKFYDETLTTQDAVKILGQTNRDKNYKRRMEDAISAALMLESYFGRKEEHV